MYRAIPMPPQSRRDRLRIIALLVLTSAGCAVTQGIRARRSVDGGATPERAAHAFPASERGDAAWVAEADAGTVLREMPTTELPEPERPSLVRLPRAASSNDCHCVRHLSLVAPSDLLSCGRHEESCTRRAVERTLGCAFTRYTCKGSVILHLEPALDAPFAEAAFDARTGRFVAARVFGAAAHETPDDKETTCSCQGPPTFQFPDLDECQKTVVSCESVEQPRWTDHQ